MTTDEKIAQMAVDAAIQAQEQAMRDRVACDHAIAEADTALELVAKLHRTLRWQGIALAVSAGSAAVLLGMMVWLLMRGSL